MLAALRSFDDNTLSNWGWVFAFIDPARTYVLVLGAIGLCYLLSRSDLLDRKPAAVLPLLACLAVLPLWQEPEMVLDASRYFLQAKHLELYGVGSFLRNWGASIAAWTDLPLVPFLYGLIFRFLGESRAPVQAFTTLLFALTLLLTWLLGKRLYDRETGMDAALLLLGIPYLLVQVPLMLADVPAMFFVTLAIAAFVEALEAGGPVRMSFASLALFCALFSKYSAGLMLLVLPVVVIVLKQGGRVHVVRRALIVLAPAAVLSLAVLLFKHDVIGAQLSLLLSYQVPGLGRWQESLASSFLFQAHPLLTAAAVVGTIQAVRKRDLTFAIPGWFALFVLLIQHERIRYFLPLFPLFTLMAARGIAELPGRSTRRFLVYCIAATSLVVSASAYVPFFQSTSMANLQEAGRFLDADATNTGAVEVRSLPQSASMGNTEMAVPLLDLYTRRKLVYNGAHAFRPDAGNIALSPLRFSWETPLPSFYRERSSGACLTVAVISGSPAQHPLPNARERSGLRQLAEFRSSTGTFRYTSSVTLFSRTLLDETAQ